MSAPHPAPDPDPDPEEDAAPSRLERQLERLDELAELGLQIARALAREASGPAPGPGTLSDIALAYDRVARAVRMTIALQSKLIDDLKARERAAADDRVKAEAEQDNARFELEQDRKVRVARILRRVIASADEDSIDRLVTEAADWLEDDDLCGDLLSRPLSEIVADICRDLGLSPDWPRLAEEAWAKAEMESGAAGSPFATAPIAATMAGGDERRPNRWPP